MRFRAILHDPGNANAERPVQILSNSRRSTGDIIGIDEWATKVLQGAISERCVRGCLPDQRNARGDHSEAQAGAEAMRITITARGEYPMPMPEPLREALAAEVEKHMQGYGLKDIRVEVYIHGEAQE